MSNLLNSASLDELVTLLGDEFREITQLFVDQLDDEVAQLQAARAGQDWRLLNRRAHALKGSSGNMGAMALAQAAAALEKAALVPDVSAIDQSLASIVELAPQSVQALRDGGYV